MIIQASPLAFVFLSLQMSLSSAAGPCKLSQSLSLSTTTPTTTLESNSVAPIPVVSTDSTISTASTASTDGSSSAIQTPSPVTSTNSASTPSATPSSAPVPQWNTINAVDTSSNEIDLSLTYFSTASAYFLGSSATYSNVAAGYGIDSSGYLFATLSDGTIAWAATVFPDPNIVDGGFHFFTDDVLNSSTGSGYNRVLCTQDEDGFLHCSSDAGGAVYFISPSNSFSILWITARETDVYFVYYDLIAR